MKWYSGENLPRTHAQPTFSEAWFHRNYGLTFGERYYSDPVMRTEQDREAMRLLHDRFGSAGIGELDPKARPNLEICGHRLPPALFGCEIFFQDDQAPSSRHLSIESAQQVAAIPRPDLQTNRWAAEFRRQGSLLEDAYGRVDAKINCGGPLNVASTTLGSESLLYLAEAPEIMQQFLALVADVCVECYDKLTSPFMPELGSGREMFLGNCPVMMLSPQTYRDSVRPADLRYRNQVQRFGLHHCGPMDRYLEVYKPLQPVDYVEVGWGSNVEAARCVFPDATLDLMINVYDLANLSSVAMEDLIRDLLRQAQPMSLIRDVWVADIGPDVPDQTILAFVEAVDRATGHLKA